MGLKCEGCGKEFGNKGGLAAHKKYCKGKAVVPEPVTAEPVTPPGEELVTINLANTITVNGTRYCGAVTCTRRMAQDLKYRDARATHAEWRIHHGEGNINDRTPFGTQIGVIRR